MRTMYQRGNEVEIGQKNKASHHEKPYLWYIQIQ